MSCEFQISHCLSRRGVLCVSICFLLWSYSSLAPVHVRGTPHKQGLGYCHWKLLMESRCKPSKLQFWKHWNETTRQTNANIQIPLRVALSHRFDRIADKDKHQRLQAVQVWVFYIKVHSAGSETRTYKHKHKHTQNSKVNGFYL